MVTIKDMVIIPFKVFAAFDNPIEGFSVGIVGGDGILHAAGGVVLGSSEDDKSFEWLFGKHF